MEPGLALRPVRLEDEPFLLRLYASTRADIAVLALGEREKAELVRMQYTAQRRHYDSHFAGAEHSIVLIAGTPAGRLYLHRAPDEHRVVDLSLLPEYRGRGFGSRLLEEILDGARRARAPVRLHVEHHSPARRLYDRLGFVPVSESDSHCFMEWRGGGLILPGRS
jgi:GNAT superfamily N-acetyltransferase